MTQMEEMWVPLGLSSLNVLVMETMLLRPEPRPEY